MPPFHYQQHHHHHQNRHCCSCCCSDGGGGAASSPPPLTGSDNLLQLLAAHLLHQSPPPPAPKPQPPPPPVFYTHLYKDQHPDPPPPAQIHSLLRSLLRRVAALESSLPNLSSPSPPPSPPPPPPPPSPSARPSLKDLAARTIQSHFRRLLVRRSQALRHLKHLAALKSHSAALKSSLSDKPHADPKLICKTAMDLLRELDSIQSGDPMIREGKRSISRELSRVLEFTEKVLIKEQQVSRVEARAAEDGGLRPAAKTTGKRVSFGESGRKSRTAHGLSGQEEDMGDEIGDLNERLQRLSRRMEDYSMVVEEAGGMEAAAYTEEADDWEVSADAERRLYMDQEGLSAPLPVQMEPRKGDGGSKKKVMVGW